MRSKPNTSPKSSKRQRVSNLLCAQVKYDDVVLFTLFNREVSLKVEFPSMGLTWGALFYQSSAPQVSPMLANASFKETSHLNRVKSIISSYFTWAPFAFLRILEWSWPFISLFCLESAKKCFTNLFC